MKLWRNEEMKKGRGNKRKLQKLNWKVTWSSARKRDRKRKISNGNEIENEIGNEKRTENDKSLSLQKTHKP